MDGINRLFSLKQLLLLFFLIMVDSIEGNVEHFSPITRFESRKWAEILYPCLQFVYDMVQCLCVCL